MSDIIDGPCSYSVFERNKIKLFTLFIFNVIYKSLKCNFYFYRDCSEETYFHLDSGHEIKMECSTVNIKSPDSYTELYRQTFTTIAFKRL